MTQALRHTLTQQICQSLNCGDVDTLSEASAPPNSTCLSQCLRVDQTGLKNCTEVVTSGCKILTKVTCGKRSDRLERVIHHTFTISTHIPKISYSTYTSHSKKSQRWRTILTFGFSPYGARIIVFSSFDFQNIIKFGWLVENITVEDVWRFSRESSGARCAMTTGI